MIAQGALQLLWFAFCLFGVAVGALNAFIDPHGALEGSFIGGLYAAFALGALPPALLGILAGVRVRYV